LKPGGLFLVQDILLPDDEETAKYVDSFERLRDPSHNRAFSQREWEEMFKAATLTVEHTEEVIKRHPFLAWAERQGNDPATIEQLIEMMNHAPPQAKTWIAPVDWETPEATFVNHHLLIAGRQ
jgi:hypothetical protein